MAVERPEQLFCKILENQFNDRVNAIEDLIELPLKGIRDVKSNILRVEKIIYVQIKDEVTRLENLVVEILLLNRINQLATIENFCPIAFQCQMLVETLMNSSTNYLSFLPTEVLSQISASYALFEKHVCVLGLRNIISNFAADILARIRSELLQLRQSLWENLRLEEIRNRYLEILQQTGILSHIAALRKFLNCGFGLCNFSSTANNKISDYMQKLALTTSGDGYTADIESLLTNYDTLNSELEGRIDDLIAVIDGGTLNTMIPIDETMKS